MGPKAKLIWMDGELRPWEEAQVHIMTHTLHYGLGVFEGIRAYQGQDGTPAIFRLSEHLARLFDSAKICGMKLPFSMAELEEACLDVLRKNDLGDAYLRPIAYYSDGEMGLGAINSVRVAIAAFPWGAYLGKEGLEQGIRATVASFNRQHLGSNPLRAKICGQYTTSILAKRQALNNGYQEAIFLDADGWVTEGTGENLFVLRDGVLKTAPERSAILPGITRDSILTIAGDLAEDLVIEIREESFARDEMLLSDEVFLTGTAAEVTPVREIDGTIVGNGKRGVITERLQKEYFRAVRGEEPRYRSWLTFVES